VDEDYRGFGLSGEIAAALLEQGIACNYGRVCTEQTIPYSRTREDEVLPGTSRILRECLRLLV
jgi:pyruvate dehydrogenase E1 component beta subunit